MKQNTRKIIGTVLLVVLVIIYAILATAVAVAQFSQSSACVHVLYFTLSGLLWIIPAMFIIKWMLKSDSA